ncbi:hypothetical protein [Bacillus sp. EE-W1]|nr:hypothetical protein [Bacillus sp. EE-W1]
MGVKGSGRELMEIIVSTFDKNKGGGQSGYIIEESSRTSGWSAI